MAGARISRMEELTSLPPQAIKFIMDAERGKKEKERQTTKELESYN